MQSLFGEVVLRQHHLGDTSMVRPSDRLSPFSSDKVAKSVPKIAQRLEGLPTWPVTRLLTFVRLEIRNNKIHNQ